MPTVTLAQAISNRNAAKIVYQNAMTNFRTAYVALMAWDIMLANKGVDGTQGFGEIINAVQTCAKISKRSESSWLGSYRAQPSVNARLHDWARPLINGSRGT